MVIHGLGSVASKKKKTDDGKEEFSVGGHTSATAVMRPKGGAGGSGNPMEDIIRSARGQDAPDPTGAGDRNIGVITIYANGYQLGDGNFQDAANPGNAAAIADLQNGHVPASLEQEIRTKWGAQVQSVGVKLVDKSKETFIPPPEKFNFAKSQGMSLGGTASSAPVDLGSIKPAEYKVDDNQPKTTIQVVLADRKKIRVSINTSATVAALYSHVMAVTNQTSFTLSGGFPPKPLKDYSATIKDSGLTGASIQQRMG